MKNERKKHVFYIKTKKNYLVNSVVGTLSQFSYLCKWNRSYCIQKGFPQPCLWGKLISIGESPLIPRETKKLIVTFAECDCVFMHKYDFTYDGLTKAGLQSMAVARTPAARNTSWKST